MLGLPEKGISRSVTKHNSDLSIVCDWIEASLLFSESVISKTDVMDSLLENELYESQDFALEFIDQVWSAIRLRMESLNGTLGLEWSSNRLQRTSGEWEDFPAYAFCLALSCASYIYPRWAAKCRFDYTTQGSLFERIAHRSFSMMLPSWKVIRVGWAPDNPVRLKTAINGIISNLNEIANAEIDLHVDDNANELGLDLLAFYSFGDAHSSAPSIMIQCASGKDWSTKRHTPDLSIWNKIVNFNSQPVKGFAIPYSFTDSQAFRKAATGVNGVFMDRYRLLNPTQSKEFIWEDSSLNNDLITWVRPHVNELPHIDE